MGSFAKPWRRQTGIAVRSADRSGAGAMQTNVFSIVDERQPGQSWESTACKEVTGSTLQNKLHQIAVVMSAFPT